MVTVRDAGRPGRAALMWARRRYRVGAVAAAVALLALSCAACGLRGGDSTNEIHVLTVEDPFFYALQSLLPEFQRQTGIKVDLEGLDYDTLNSRSTNSFLTHQNDIDVISPDSMWLSRFANSGWLVNLNDRIRRDRAQVRPGDFIPNVMYSLSEWNGGIYTLPVASYGMSVLYRPDVFRALHLRQPPSRPTANWTWADYLHDIEQINGKTVNGTKMFGTVVAGSGPQPVLHMYSQLAASMGARWFKSFPESQKWNFTPTFDSAETLASLRYFQTLYKNSPPPSINYVWFDAGTAFSKGNVGMFYWWTPYSYLVRKSSYMGTKNSSVVGKYKVAPLPQDPPHKPVVSIGGYAFGISRYSQHQSLAWKFIKWASSAQTQRRMALLPNHQFADFARRSVYSDAQLKKIYGYLPTQLSVLEHGDGKSVRPPIPDYTTLEGVYGQAVNEVLAGSQTPDAALQNVQQKAQSILKNELYLPWHQPSYDDTPQATAKLLSRLAGAGK